MKRYRWLALFLLLPLMAASADDDLARHWAYDKNQPLEMSQVGVQERDGIKIYDISYKAPVGDRAPLIGPNGGNVTAYLVVPPGKGPFPAVIYCHWCMPGSEKKNRTEFLDEAIVLAHSGVISFLLDHVTVHPGFVEDKSPQNEQQVAVDVQQDINHSARRRPACGSRGCRSEAARLCWSQLRSGMRARFSAASTSGSKLSC